ncbi:unnamed protein product [Spirodela intermedia]|uniref:Uncharacterized protein n=1 Tax=Spirodela intermedia TaxID=51605 RepID=A0A7I8IF10_SPIIN|nr:unnamed protein product [Spirodela intermedia]CAA6655974.1 unnamed protein product [Spirodela intermedia]
MELLLELLLTVLSSLLIAFFFSKIVSVSSSNSKDPDAHLHPEGLQSLPGRSSTSAATHGIEGDAEVNREWFEGLDEARERADTCRDECIGTRFEESIHLEDQYVKEVVGGSQEVRAEDLDVKKVDIQGNPDAAVTEIEENLGTETCMTVEEEPLDEDRKINFSLSPDEEEAFQVPDIREAGTESVIDGARDALLGTVDVKVAKTDIGSIDVEKLFGEAAEFVGSTEGNEALSELSNDLQMQLFGLRKIPLALKASARAKWYN